MFDLFTASYWRKKWKSAVLASVHNPQNEPRSKGMLIDCGDFQFVVDSRDMFVGKALRDNGAYEVEELQRLRDRVTPQDRVLFLGSHIGAMALPIAQHCESVAMVEANPDTFQLLQANTRLNGITNATPYPYAAGESSGSIRFVKNTFNSGGSKREPKTRRDFYYDDNPETVDVPMVRLDDLFAGQAFDVAVVDVEGSEIFAFQGMPRLLSELRVLIVEFIPHHIVDAAGASVADFLAPLTPHFDKLTVPTQNRSVGRSDMLGVLNDMVAADEMDGGLIFERSAD